MTSSPSLKWVFSRVPVTRGSISMLSIATMLPAYFRGTSLSAITAFSTATSGTAVCCAHAVVISDAITAAEIALPNIFTFLADCKQSIVILCQ